MYPMEIINGVKLITETCFTVKGGEKIMLVAFEEEDLRIASVLAAEMKAAGAEVAIIVVEPPRGIEPPSFVAEAMKKVDICISFGQIDYGHTLARKEAPSLQYAYMPPVMRRSLGRSDILPEDLLEIARRTERLAEAVSNAKEARISSPSGTDLLLNLEGRRGIPIHPIFRKPGHLAIIPFYAEVACAPVEGEASGTYVANGSIWGHESLERVLQEPVVWYVENGKVLKLTGGREAEEVKEILSGFDENAWSIGELGIGTNHKLSSRLTGTKLDDAILGTVHLALGRNVALGGTQWSQIHADFLAMGVQLELDGKTIIKNGRYFGEA